MKKHLIILASLALMSCAQSKPTQSLGETVYLKYGVCVDDSTPSDLDKIRDTLNSGW